MLLVSTFSPFRVNCNVVKKTCRLQSSDATCSSSSPAARPQHCHDPALPYLDRFSRAIVIITLDESTRYRAHDTCHLILIPKENEISCLSTTTTNTMPDFIASKIASSTSCQRARTYQEIWNTQKSLIMESHNAIRPSGRSCQHAHHQWPHRPGRRWQQTGGD